MAGFLDKVDRMTDALGRRLDTLTQGEGVGFSALATPTAAAPTARDWTSLLGTSAGRGLGWAQSALGGAGGGLSWAALSRGGDLGRGFDLSGFDTFNALRGAREARERAEQIATTSRRLTEAGVGAIGVDANTDRWRDLIDQAAARYGIDGDAIQAVMMIESGGNPGAVSSAGARGLMQVMPFHFQPGEDGFDPRTNVFKGASILADNYRRYGNWDKAVAAYLGAIDANGNIIAAQDANGTDGFAYARLFNDNLARIKRARGATASAGNGAGLAGLFGGRTFGVTQGFGRTEFSTGQGADIYDFGGEFGLDGDEHTGWDLGAPVGTNVYLPAGLAGTVTIAGGSGYYRDESGTRDPATSGEVRILLDNGMELILGHNAAINVRAGQRVTAGTLLGQTGWANGAHLHVEVRRRDPSTRSGWRIVDPRILFGGPTGGAGNYTP